LPLFKIFPNFLRKKQKDMNGQEWPFMSLRQYRVGHPWRQGMWPQRHEGGYERHDKGSLLISIVESTFAVVLPQHHKLPKLDMWETFDVIIWEK